ncbi:MAG: twin-arginine translocase subunit TatC [Proteobacteria bacterium]|nr:twin-arginine translocase subunit TatC [Pseudomonadota bacterium]
MSQFHQDSHDLEAMPFFEHIKEVRKRLIVCILPVMVVFFVAFYCAPWLIDFFKGPLEKVATANLDLGFKEVTEPFLVSLKVAFLCAFLACSPIWLGQIFLFLKPALYSKEKMPMVMFFLCSLGLFWLGALFCFYVIMPFALDFLLQWGQKFAVFDVTLQGYFSFLTVLILGFGVVFELPLVLVLLSMMGVVCAADLRKMRRYVFLGCFLIAAMLTPPDWLSQVGMAVPMYILYELAVWLVSIRERRLAKDTSRG